MTKLRKDIEAVMRGAFPFTFEFLYWEEVGIIGEELLQNLLVCSAVIVVMVASLIPSPRISAIVIGSILVSIVDVVGLLYFWDVTISGVSTIYILICVGLAVDYAAHIAHMFKESHGTARERARASLGRVGPSVFNAVVSTFLAVLVIGFSKSYIFKTFFKALFLVTVIAGAHGLVLLPVLLSMFGGDNGVANPDDFLDGSPKAGDQGPVHVKVSPRDEEAGGNILRIGNAPVQPSQMKEIEMT
jgi:hypothetical protein